MSSGNSSLALEQWLEPWMENPFLLWGIGPSLVIFITYIFTFLLLEWVIRQNWCAPYLLVYTSKENRRQKLEEMYSSKGLSFLEQLSSALWQVAGPLNAFGCVFNGYVFPMVIPKHSTMFPEWKAFFVDFVLLALVADFALYWGHRIQHGKCFKIPSSRHLLKYI